ncbi:MAG: hypothetical protein LBR79_06790 [Oscillospiraceae bacterium]|jgi:hypothetical protein|nr:hypothetical protein [Oscillospiraceae bacterium]
MKKLELAGIKFKHNKIVTPKQKKEHHELKENILRVGDEFFNYLNNDAKNVKKKADKYATSVYPKIESIGSSYYNKWDEILKDSKNKSECPNIFKLNVWLGNEELHSVRAQVRSHFLASLLGEYQHLSSYFNGLFWENYLKDCSAGKLTGDKLLGECQNDFNNAKNQVNGISSLIVSMKKDVNEYKKLCLLAKNEADALG